MIDVIEITDTFPLDHPLLFDEGEQNNHDPMSINSLDYELTALQMSEILSKFMKSTVTYYLLEQ